MSKQLVLSVGMPRGGSGWYYNLTQDLIIASGGINARHIRSKYKLGRLLTKENCNIGTVSFYRLLPVMLPLLFEQPYVIKLHAERRPLADWLIEKGLIKPTYIYRDPRDALLSAYEYGQGMSSRGFKNAFTHLETIEDAIHFMDQYVKIAQGWMASGKTLKVKYENLLEDYDTEVRRLAGHLDINIQDKNVLQVIERYRPGMKPEVNYLLHFRKGKIGRHQEKFTVEQLEECDRLFGSFLKKYGYAQG